MSVQVVTVTSRIPDRSREPYYRYQLWHDSLTYYGCQPTVLGMGEHWQGLMTKPRRLRDWLRSGACTADLLISSDSYDVVFKASPEEVGRRFLQECSSDRVLFNAEKGLFPRGDLKDLFDAENYVKSDWCYLNSGLYIGTPEAVLAMLEAMQLDDLHDDYQRPDSSWCHVNDQAWYQVAWCLQKERMRLDYKCEVFQCCSACELDEFDTTSERIQNKRWKTEPVVWHFNGNSKDLLLPQFLPKWGMEHYL